MASDVLNTEQSQDKDFLLKIYLENHKLLVFDSNGSMDHQAYQRYDAICLHSNLNNRERKHARSKRDKNSILAISACASKLLRSKNYSL